MSEETIASLKKEIDYLKKKLSVATIVGLVIGSGGLFGIIKWVSSDRQLTAAQTRLQTVETEVLKLDTLTDIYEQEKEKIDAEKNTLNSEKLDELDELDAFGQYERLERHQQLEQRDRMNESLLINIRDIQEKIGNAIKQR